MCVIPGIIKGKSHYITIKGLLSGLGFMWNRCLTATEKGIHARRGRYFCFYWTLISPHTNQAII